MIQSTCLCGKIAFEAQEIPTMVFNCHCSRCRKSHGAAYATQVICQKSSLNFLRGKNILSEYEVSGVIRAFCSYCGSRLMNYSKQEEYLSIALSVIDNGINLKPLGECFVNEKLPFIQLDSSIDHFKQLPIITNDYTNS